jgi:hypothetical protein
MSDKTPYFITIPGLVRKDKRLTPNAKLLFGDIAALCNSIGHCWASNAYLSTACGVDKNTVSKMVSLLEETGHIKTEIKRSETGEIVSRFIKIAIPAPFSVNTPTLPNSENNSKGENSKEDTTCVQGVATPQKRVNWDSPKSELQAFMGYYLKRCMPNLYAEADPKQVGGFFRQYGKMFSSMLATAGTAEVAGLALDAAIVHYGAKGYQWGLKALSTNWIEFVNEVMDKRKRNANI